MLTAVLIVLAIVAVAFVLVYNNLVGDNSDVSDNGISFF